MCERGPGGARHVARRCAIAVGAVLLLVAASAPAAATDHMYFAATDNITNVIVQKINAETVRVDLRAGT